MDNNAALSILRRLIEDSQSQLSTGAAEAILQLQFAPADHQRMDQLASKSNLGALSPGEAAEYDGYIAAADVLSLWKSKARLALKRHPSAA